MSKSKIILFNGPPKEYIISNLSSRIDPSTFEVKKPPEEEACEAVRDATLIIAYPGKIHLDEKILEASSNVKLIQFFSVGYDNIDIGAATELRIPVANNPGWPATSVAEHTMMLILMTLKQAIYMYTKTVQNAWKEGEGYPKRYELRGKTLGLLGLGSIGQEVARLATVFGVKKIYHKRNRLSESEEASLGVKYRTLDELLEEADVLSIHVLLTEETRGMIGAGEIAKMKDSAVIVNTARKHVVDESAVFEALEEGKLFGFGTDFVPDRPLSGLENVVMTPHSAVTPEAMVRMGAQGFNNVIRLLRGEKPLYMVNDVWPSEL
jgi:lactate dehydrogenase-like 2-hydroxyacid dehydrogenase